MILTIISEILNVISRNLLLSIFRGQTFLISTKAA